MTTLPGGGVRKWGPIVMCVERYRVEVLQSTATAITAPRVAIADVHDMSVTLLDDDERAVAIRYALGAIREEPR